MILARAKLADPARQFDLTASAKVSARSACSRIKRNESSIIGGKKNFTPARLTNASLPIKPG